VLSLLGSQLRNQCLATLTLVLANCPLFDDNQVAIAKTQTIAPLVELARSGTAGAKTQAAGALRNLAANADNKKAMRRLGYQPS